MLYARVATGFCPHCDVPITSQTRDQIIARLQSLSEAPEYLILAPVVRGQKGEYRELFESLQRQGYARARVDGEVYRLAEIPALQRQQKHDIEVVVSRFSPGSTPRTTIATAVAEALKLGENSLYVTPWLDGQDHDPSSPPTEPTAARGKRRRRATHGEADLVFSSQYACPQCGHSSLPPTPQLLSFNSPVGMCGTCGDWESIHLCAELIIPDPTLSIRRGGGLLGSWSELGRWQRHQLLASESGSKRMACNPGKV